MRGMLMGALLAVSACGTIRPKVTYSGYGAADPQRDETVVETASVPEVEAEPTGVVVLVDAIPKGVEVEGGKITIEDGYEHVLLGKFAVTPGRGHSLMGLLVFPKYNDKWRKGYCYPQTVLNYATLMLWSLVVPPSYPCWGDSLFDKAGAVAYAKRVAAAAGGDLVVMSYLGSPQGRKKKITAIVGIVLKADPRMTGPRIETKPGKLSESDNVARR